MSDKPVLALVLPCYNEEEIVEQSSKILLNLLENLISKEAVSEKSYICFVDDGSTDNSYEKLKKMAENNLKLKVIKLLYNFGHQKALLCGMIENEADIYITLDADLQDDIDIIYSMVEKYNAGNIDVVYGVRSDRDTDNFVKKFFADSFYKISSFIGVKGLPNHADFRLVSKKVVQAVQNNKEYNLYIRGLIYNFGFKSDILYYSRKERIGGQSKYSFLQSLDLAIDGITSLSTSPIKIIFIISFFMLLCSFLFQSLILFTGSVNLFCIGIVGEYIAKTYLEAKQRPNYLIDEKINYSSNHAE